MRFNPDKPNDCKFCDIASAIGPLIGGAISLFGGSKAAGAAEDAAGVQAQSAREAIALGREGLGFQQEMFDTSRADLAPWRNTGGAALGPLADMFIPGGQSFVQMQGQLNDLKAQRAVLARTANQPVAPPPPAPVQQVFAQPPVNIHAGVGGGDQGGGGGGGGGRGSGADGGGGPGGGF